MSYDSHDDTVAHIQRVDDLLGECCARLVDRGVKHDRSKLEEPEKSAFDTATPKLKKLEYGSPEYKASLDELQDALRHHYANNSHHPEHYENGIDGMSLFDLLEMLMDWKAAGERHESGNIHKSLEKNVERFKIDPQVASILFNTIKEMGW